MAVEGAAASLGRGKLRVDQVLAGLDAVGLHAGAGDQVAAARVAAVVREQLDGLGADGLRRRLDELVDPPAVTPSSTGPLTLRSQLSPAELRVAELVGTGASNPEVAEQLYISRRTVESHLSHIYVKLGISSRVELALRVQAEG